MTIPKHINVIDVGPRDGFQNIKTQIPTQTKLDVIEALIASGVRAIEVTSFVHPKAVPQMADAAEVAKTIVDRHQKEGLRIISLVPNQRGAQNAFDNGIREVTYVISASEKHNMANVNRTREESLADLKNIVQAIPSLKVRAAIATTFGCPFEGKIEEKTVLDLMAAVIDSGAKEIILCDTIGVANPAQVKSLAEKAKSASKNMPVVLHLHNTRGMGLANTYAAIEAGIETFETTVGGLGGCPFAPGAAGNTATEDMVNMLHSMGIQTGINLDEYLKAVYLVRDQIQSSLTSNMVNACKYDNI